MQRKRQQLPNSGYSNLLSYIYEDHKNYKEEAKAKTLPYSTSSLKPLNIYKCLEWVIVENLDFSFCESAYTAQNCNLEPITRQTPVNYLDKTVEAVETEISKKLPQKFGLIIDGWSAQSTHYLVFFSYLSDEDGIVTSVRLAMSPLLNEQKKTAVSHFDFIAATLRIFGETLYSIAFLVGENKNLNKNIAKLFKSSFHWLRKP